MISWTTVVPHLVAANLEQLYAHVSHLHGTECDQIRNGERACDERDRGSVLTNCASGKKAPRDSTAHAQRIGPFPWTPIGFARRESADGVTCQAFLGSVCRDNHSERQSMPVPRQDAINFAATSQGDSPSELSIYRYTEEYSITRVSAGRK